jgi:hypothetical protein
MGAGESRVLRVPCACFDSDGADFLPWAASRMYLLRLLACRDAPPSAVPVVRSCRPLRAHGELRAHLARREFGNAVRAAQHSPPRRASPAWLSSASPRRYTWPGAADHFGHIAKCARIRRPVSWAPPLQPQFQLRHLRASEVRVCVPSTVHMVRGCRPLRAYGEVRAVLTPGTLGAATPTAFHPRAWLTCARIRLALTRAPHPRPHNIRRPGGGSFRDCGALVQINYDFGQTTESRAFCDRPALRLLGVR